MKLQDYPKYVQESIALYQRPRMDAQNINTVYSVGSDGSKMLHGIARSGEAMYLDAGLIRRNARRAYHESTAARSIIRRHLDTVIDVGLRFSFEPEVDILGISKERARKWADENTKRFHLFLSSKDSTTDNSCTGYQLQRFLFLHQYRDGEYFVRFNRLKNERKNSISYLSFQPIDSEQIDGNNVVSTGGYNDAYNNDYFIRDGIVKDVYGKEIGYLINIRESNKNSAYKSVKIKAETIDGITQMVHGMTADYINQSRGLSGIGHILQDCKLFTDFDIAHVQKAALQASLFMAVESEGEEDAVDPFENALGAGVGISANSLIAPPTNQELDSVDSQLTTYHEMDEAIISQPGRVGIFNLPAKQKANLLQNTSPVTQYPDFVQAFLSILAASSDQAIETVLMKFGQNYSASRATLILVWRIACIYRQDFESDFLNVAKKAWLEIEIAEGRTSCPGWQNPILRAAWLNGRWIGVPMPEINPYDQARANAMNAMMGATDLDTIALQTNGSNGEKNREKLTRQIEGLPLMPWKESQKDEAKEEGINGEEVK